MHSISIAKPFRILLFAGAACIGAAALSSCQSAAPPPQMFSFTTNDMKTQGYRTAVTREIKDASSIDLIGTVKLFSNSTLFAAGKELETRKYYVKSKSGNAIVTVDGSVDGNYLIIQHVGVDWIEFDPKTVAVLTE